ncbi:hypothetical protein ACLKA6_005232 [Drosophila palustris]
MSKTRRAANETPQEYFYKMLSFGRKAHHEVHTDASATGLAGVLLQSHDKIDWKPVSYFSRHCNDTESRYHSYELEILAVVETLKRFRVYVLGKSFRLVTDCAAIAKAKTNKELIPKIARWWFSILDYNCEIIHREGTKMAHVDAMSRAPDLTQQETLEETIRQITNNVDDWLLTMQLQDTNLVEIIGVLQGTRQSDQAKQIQLDFAINNHRLYRKPLDVIHNHLTAAIHAESDDDDRIEADSKSGLAELSSDNT